MHKGPHNVYIINKWLLPQINVTLQSFGSSSAFIYMSLCIHLTKKYIWHLWTHKTKIKTVIHIYATW